MHHCQPRLPPATWSQYPIDLITRMGPTTLTVVLATFGYLAIGLTGTDAVSGSMEFILFASLLAGAPAAERQFCPADLCAEPSRDYNDCRLRGQKTLKVGAQIDGIELFAPKTQIPVRSYHDHSAIEQAVDGVSETA